MSAAASTNPLRSAFTQADLAALVRGKESSPDELKAVADQLAMTYRGQHAPEAVRMFIAIASGSKMTGESGWFGPAQSRFHWTSLAERHGVDPQSGIADTAFEGRPEWFARLDRNRDGVIAREDLDWSESNSWVQHAYPVNRLLRRLDKREVADCLAKTGWRSSIRWRMAAMKRHWKDCEKPGWREFRPSIFQAMRQLKKDS